MDYFNAFCRWTDLCSCTDSSGQNQAASGPCYGPARLLRCCLEFLGFYQPFTEYAGAGASVPLLGFGNILWKGMKKAIDENGFLGLFTGGFTACAVGVSAALIFSYLASLIFHPRMKE